MDVFLMIRRHNLTIFLDAKESSTIYEVKRMIEGITKRPPEEQLLIKDDQPLDDGKQLLDYNMNVNTTKAQQPATIGLCFITENGQFEPLEIAPLSVPPELPDAMKPSESQGIEQRRRRMPPRPTRRSSNTKQGPTTPTAQPSIALTSSVSRNSAMSSSSSVSPVPSRSQGISISSISFPTSQPVYFPKPLVIIYRFLNVLKSRNRFVFEIIDYVEKNLYQFLKEFWNNDDLMQLIEELRIESYYDSCLNEDAPVIFRSSQAPEAVQDSIVMYVLWKCYKFRDCLDIGRDNPGLKRLIHYVLLDGMVSNQYRLSVEQSVMQTVERISRQGIRQYLISTIAHKLFDNQRLLAFTDKGDIMPYFGYLDGFNIDTRKKQTFVQIAKKFNLPPSCILFVGFSNTECKKAARAGFMVAKIKEKDQKPPKYYTIRIIPELASIHLLDHQIGVPKSASTSASKDRGGSQQQQQQ